MKTHWTKTYWAVYQSGFGILGVGKTTLGALWDANKWDGSNKPKLKMEDIHESDYNQVVGELYFIPISPDLYNHVKTNGGMVGIEKDVDIYRLPSELE